jgi:type II secretory ATPase GspE/PulE/Tfp pilus assembly ATPase PilB-like protein
MSEEIESLAVRRANREELESMATEQGMRSLWDDGLAKVVSGVTSLEELGRVLV